MPALPPRPPQALHAALRPHHQRSRGPHRRAGRERPLRISRRRGGFEAGVSDSRAGKAVANLLLQSGAKRANERSSVAAIEDADSDAALSSIRRSHLRPRYHRPRCRRTHRAPRGRLSVSAAGADELFGLLCEPDNRDTPPESLAQSRGLLLVRDDAAIDAWVQQAIDANPQAAADVRAGKEAAAGRIVGAAAKLAAGKADAAELRKRIMAALGRG